MKIRRVKVFAGDEFACYDAKDIIHVATSQEYVEDDSTVGGHYDTVYILALAEDARSAAHVRTEERFNKDYWIDIADDVRTGETHDVNCCCSLCRY